MTDIIFKPIEAKNPTCAICGKEITIYALNGDPWSINIGSEHYHEDCLDRMRPGWREQATGRASK